MRHDYTLDNAGVHKEGFDDAHDIFGRVQIWVTCICIFFLRYQDGVLGRVGISGQRRVFRHNYGGSRPAKYTTD